MKPEEKKKTLEEHLIKRIKKSGYPLEIEISNLLDKDYVVFNTKYYFDEETKKGRDIDIYASPSYFDVDRKLVDLEKKLLPFKLRTEIAVECKKSETHAWVFYTSQNVKLSGYHISGQVKTSVPKRRTFSTDSFEWILQKCLTFHYRKFERVAIAYDEIKKKKLEKEKTKKDNSTRRELFEAINQLVKFTCYEIHQSFDRISKLPKPSMYKAVILIFFPTIVFDGDMFEVTFDSGEPKLERKNHIILGTTYRCPYCQEVESFMFDVVHRSYFSEFMKILRADYTEVRKSMLKKHDELVKSAKNTRQKYGSKTTEGTFG